MKYMEQGVSLEDRISILDKLQRLELEIQSSRKDNIVEMKDIDIDDDAFKGVEAIIKSMTPAERENPALLNGSRRKRIADGSGTSIVEVNRLMKQFEDMRKMMKMVSGGGAKNLARMMSQQPRR